MEEVVLALHGVGNAEERLAGAFGDYHTNATRTGVRESLVANVKSVNNVEPVTK